jgi:parallel beta-helix repeat protein
VLLWSKRIPGFAQAVPENDTSYDWAIEQNTFVGNNKAIRIIANQDHGIRPLKPSGEWGYPSPAPHDHTIRENLIEDNRIGIELSGVERTIIAENTFRHNVETDVKEF